MVVVGLSILATSMWTAKSEAHCHIYRVWHFHKPQRCFTALAKRPVAELSPELSTKPERKVPNQERIDIPVPSLDFNACPEGDGRLVGIAKLRALEDVPAANR